MDRFKETKRAGLLGIIGNIILLILKGSIGFITHSQAMIADTFNSASDIFASLMTFIGNKIASAPKDDSHNFGHGKAEYLFSMFISLTMIIVAIKLLINSTHALVYKEHLIFSWFLVVVCIITIAIKLFLYIYTKKLCKKYDNILLKANNADHRNDCIVTTFTLISVVSTLYDIYWIDGVVGIGIAIWIAFTGIKIFIESYNVLMDKSLDEESKNLILNLIEKYKDIKNIDSLYSIPVGYQYIVVLTICVDGNMSTFDSHKLADTLEKDITNLSNVYNTIVHIHPVK